MQIHGENTEFVQLGEKTSNFDVAFRARNPLLSDGDVQVSLHVDIEPQKTYRLCSLFLHYTPFALSPMGIAEFLEIPIEKVNEVININPDMNLFRLFFK